MRAGFYSYAAGFRNRGLQTFCPYPTHKDHQIQRWTVSKKSVDIGGRRKLGWSMPSIIVEKLDAAGAITAHPFQYYPCIRFRYSFQAPTILADGTTQIYGLRDAVALVDTGADLNLIRRDLIPNDTTPVQTVTSLGVNGSTREEIFSVSLYLAEADMVHSTGVMSWTPANNPPYNMIVGRKFLQMCRFEFDRHKGIRSIEFGANPEAV